MKRGIIFDMDGVLLDSGPQHLQSWQMLAAEHGKEFPESLFWETFGCVNRSILPRCFGRPMSEEEIIRLGDRKEELYRQLITGQAVPLAGIPELLQALHLQGWNIAVGSSGPRANVELAIRELELTEWVSAYTCSEDVSHGKPNPEVFLKAAALIATPSARCVVVEDSLHGIQAAKAAGMKCIAITTTKPRAQLGTADLVIDSFRELAPRQVAQLLETA